VNVTRRQFVSWGLAAGAALGVEGLGQAFFGHVMRTSSRMDTPVPSVCRACPAGCGLVGYLRENARLVAILGNPEHPASQGKLCALALAGINLHYHPERLWQAERRDGRTVETAAAIERAGRTIAELVATGAEVVIDTWDEQQPHADFLAALAGHGRVIGREALAGANRRRVMTKVWGAEVRPDLSKTDLLLIFGDQPLDSGPRFIQDARRIVEARTERQMKMIVFDPRLSNTGGKADLWIPLRPGTERVAALALVRHALEHLDLNLHVTMKGQRVPLYTLAEALTIYDFEYAAQVCDVELALLERAGDMLTEARKTATMAGDGIFDRSDALDTYAAIALIDVMAGPLPFAVMPRPRFVPAGAACDAAEAESTYASLENGAARQLVLITHRANPVYERGSRLERALVDRHVAFHVAISPLPNETTAAADVVIPEALPLESDGRVWLSAYVPTPTYVEQRPIASPPKGVLTAREVFAGLARHLGRADTTAPQNDFHDVRGWTGAESFFEIAKGIYAGDAEYAPSISYQIGAEHFADESAVAIAAPPAGSFDLLLHDGPVTSRDTAQAKWLAEIQHADALFVHPDDARRLRVRSGDFVQVVREPRPDAETPTAPSAPVRVKVFVSEGIRPGCVSMVVGQGHQAAGRLALGRPFASRLDPDMKLIWWEHEGNGRNLQPLVETVVDDDGAASRPLVRLRVKRA
jgi:anaerobic selenocysteine-containing dehydrogenase